MSTLLSRPDTDMVNEMYRISRKIQMGTRLSVSEATFWNRCLDQMRATFQEHYNHWLNQTTIPFGSMKVIEIVDA